MSGGLRVLPSFCIESISAKLLISSLGKYHQLRKRRIFFSYARPALVRFFFGGGTAKPHGTHVDDILSNGKELDSPSVSAGSAQQNHPTVANDTYSSPQCSPLGRSNVK